MQTEPENPTKENEKKPYQTPKLIKHGTIEEITGAFLDVPEVSGFAPDS